MSLPKISIVLPTYNGSRYLRGAIESCLNQTYRNIELIVVDDGSTDETPEIIRFYAEADSRVKHIRNRRNLRLPRLLNAGFAAATGEYLTWTSDDNEYLLTALEEMLRFLQANPAADFVYADMVVLDSKTGQKMIRPCTHWTLRSENMLGACTLYTRRVWETVGQFNPRFEWVEDYDYWLRVEKRFTMRRLAKVLYLYRNRPGSLTRLMYWPIAFLAYLLRFHHGYSTVDQLAGIGGVLISNSLPLSRETFKIWRPLLQRVTGLNFKLMMASGFAILRACLRKAGVVSRPVRKKVLGIFRRNQDPLQGKLAGLRQGSPGKRQVLCILPFLTLGGSEKVMQDLARGLSPRGFDFHLFSFRQDENPWVRQLISPFASFIGMPEISNADSYAEHLIQVIRDLNVEIVLLTNAPVAYRSLARIKAAFPSLKIVDILHLERVGGTQKGNCTVGAPDIDRRVCISHWLSGYMKRQYAAWGIPAALADRLRVIHNGTDPADFSRTQVAAGRFRQQHEIPREARIISFIGRMVREKNPLLFIDVARGILAKHPALPLRFVMAGYGPLLDALRSEVKHNGLEDYFVFPGAVTNVAELLCESFLLVHPSSHEGIPLAIQEAMWMNVPVISTRVGAIEEIVQDGANGFLVELDEHVVENAVARSLYLLSHEEAYQEMARNARKGVDPEFALETMCRRYEELFLEVLGHREAVSNELPLSLVY